MNILHQALNTSYEVQTDRGIEHKKVKHLILDIFIIGLVLFGIISSFYVASAATYSFIQSSWAGGADTSTTATHTSNKTGWTKYYSQSNVSALAGGVSFPVSSKSIVDDGDTSTTTTVTATPYGVAFDSYTNSIWGVSGASASPIKIRASDGATLGNYGGALYALDAMFDPVNNSVWYDNNNSATLYKLNPSTGAITNYSVPTGSRTRLKMIDPSTNTIWVNNWNNQLLEVSLSSGSSISVVRTCPQTHTYSDSYLFDTSSNYVWWAPNASTTLNLMDPATCNVLASYNIGSAISTAASGATVMALDDSSNSLLVSTAAGLKRVNRSSGVVLNTYASIIANTITVDTNSKTFFVATTTGNTITQVRLSDGVVLKTYTTGTGSNIQGAIVYDSSTDSVWVPKATAPLSINKVKVNNTFLTGTNSSTAVTGSGSAGGVGLAYICNASGGNTVSTTTAPGYCLHTFTSSGTLTVNTLPASGTVAALVVGGGGAGGSSNNNGGAGGGGGGVLYNASLPISVTSYSVVVGASVAGNYASATGNHGNNSSFSTMTAIGGGGGGSCIAGGPGASGGSGGGGGTCNSSGYAGGAGTSGQGNAGGTGYPLAAGGGGAGAAGSSGAGADGTNTGGSGIANSITGSSIYYGGGGGGAAAGASTVVAAGGSGGGGAGAYYTNHAGVSGTNGLGGGGGGGVNTAAYTSGGGGSGVVIIKYPSLYSASGTFTSAVINTGAKSNYTTLNWNSTIPANTAIAMEIRAGNTATPDGTWTSWTSVITNGGDISSFAGNQYVQYRATLSTTDTTVTPTLNDVTINYNQYKTVGNLVSSVYDSESDANLVAGVSFTATGGSSDEVASVQVRSSPNGTSSWTSWCGPTSCNDTDAFTSSGSFIDGHTLKTGGNDRYFQYRILLTGSGDDTKTVSNVTVSYVVNAPPQFDASYGTNGVNVVEATSTSATAGKVLISYSVRDPDGTTGTANASKIYPSFEYNTGSGWTPIATTSLATGDTNLKDVLEVGYTPYTATWDAHSQLGNVYATSTQIRVIANDNEAANNITVATSTSFILDTTPPVVTLNLSDTDDTISLSASDVSGIASYQISNDINFASSTNGVGTSTAFAYNSSWTPSYATSTATVYAIIKDFYGNYATTTTVAPHFTDSMAITDVSNPTTNQYREFVAWPVYPVTNGNGADFAKYELYKSTDGVSYSLLSSITNSTINYYTDANLASSTVYYYKVRFVDTDGDSSNYSNVVYDKADGTGGTDVVKPIITNVTATGITNTSATITFDTDKLAQSVVEYGKTNVFGSQATSQSYVLTGHSISLSNLDPNTVYYYKVSATDISNNTGTSNNGYTFTTAGGPLISNVTASSTDNSGTKVTITWTTNTASDSSVSYSQDSTLATVTTVTSADAGATSHSVNLTGLTPNTTYYFSVASTDAQSNTTTLNNLNGVKYSFSTGLDIQPPVISNASTSIGSSLAVITWNTDKLANSEVDYGPSAGSYTKHVTLNTNTIAHSVILSEQTSPDGGGNNTLTASTTYHYVIISKGANNISATTDDASFTTSSDPTADLTAQLTASQAQTTSLRSQLSNTNGLGGTGSGSTADTSKPVITNISVDKITASSANINFTTSKTTRSLIEYGISTSYDQSTGDNSLLTTHTITLKGLTLGTEYHFVVDVVDSVGNVTNSIDQTFKTSFIAEDLGTLASLGNTFNTVQSKLEDLITSALPSLNPPFISKPTVVGAEQDTAEIDFTTNVKAYSGVQYATDDEWKSNGGKYVGEVADTDNKLTDHKFTLTNLKPGNMYHFSVRAYVFNQATSKTDDDTFLTKAGDVEARVTDRKKDSFRVTWTTSVPTSSTVEYKKSGGTQADRQSDLTLNTYHDVLIENLKPNTTYLVKAYGDDANGNRISAKTELTVTTSQDVTPPTISNFNIQSTLVPGNNSKIQTLVSWKTDEPATTAVYYGEGSGSVKDVLPNKQEDTSTLTTNHTMIITNLKPGAIYRLQVSSKDDAENEAMTPMRTIITPKQSESIVDVIFSNFDSTFQFINNIKK